jgi:hypothetical protein
MVFEKRTKEMATIQSLNRLLAHQSVRYNLAAPQHSRSPSANHSLVQSLARLSQHLLGLTLVLMGSALVFTLWLLPLGLPLVLLGIALITAPSSFHPLE